MARIRPDLASLAGPIGPSQSAGPDSGIIAALSPAALSPYTQRPADAVDPRTGSLSAPLSAVAPHPDNARSAIGDLEEMVASMRGPAGVITALTVTTAAAYLAAHPKHRFDPEVRWVIIAGHRRHAAASLAGLDSVPIVVRDDLAGDESAVVSMLIENIHRAGLDPLDEAAALQRLATGGMKQREMSSRTGISQSNVSKRLALLRLPDNAKAGLAAKTLTIQDAHRLLEIGDKDRVAAAYEQHITDRASIDMCVRAQLHQIQLESDIAVARGRIKSEGLKEIDPLTQFASGRWKQQLATERDIEGARSDKSLVASVNTRNGAVEYWTTRTPPWPWIPNPTPHQPTEPDGSTMPHSSDTDTDTDIDAEGFSDEPGRPSISPEEHTAALHRQAERDRHATARAERIAGIKEFLAGTPTTEQTVEVLTSFVFAMSYHLNVGGGHALDYIGEGDAGWEDYDQWLSSAAKREGTDRTRAALSVAIVAIEEEVTFELAAEPFHSNDYPAAVASWLTGDESN